jgi:DNA-binding transcriptional regulator LsrR (DeoR family)
MPAREAPSFSVFLAGVKMARKALPADLYLLSKVSKLYYERGLNQQEIADKLHLSRPKVSRLLQQAQEEGIVQITVHSPPGTFADLEEALETRFGLKEAVVVEVVDAESQDAVSRALGIAASNYFKRNIQDGDIIGISWGKTLNAMVNALSPIETKNVHVVQMIGGLGQSEADEHATSLCRRLTQLLNSKLTLLPAPGIVDNQAVREAILSDSHMQRVFELFHKITVAYVGIGAPTPDSVVLRDGAIMSQQDIAELKQRGAVGDIALRYFDLEGKLVYSEIDERVIGISLEQLKQIPHVVGITGGPQKEDVVCGVLRGRWINALVTDQITAKRMLELPVSDTKGSSL